jgi:hypothetical protein
MGEKEVREAQREAHLEAAPFAAATLAANVGLALASREARWELFGSHDWWIWLAVGAPSAVLVATFAVGPTGMGLVRASRRLAIVLLALLGLGNAAGIGCVIVSLMHWTPEGPQLLASAACVLFTNVVTFALVFWELDNGGPVARALVERRSTPDFQFPQDDDPDLARPGWAPTLVDYAYVSITNAIAFSPTDTMPLTRPAKLYMAIEAGVSAVTVLVVTARAINILG